MSGRDPDRWSRNDRPDRVLERLAADLHGADDLGESARHIVGMAQDHLGCDHASLTFRHKRDGLETLAVTDDVVRKAEQLQQELREGPGLLAMWSQSDVAVDDVAGDQRWPRWGVRAESVGVVSVLAVGMSTRRGPDGCLSLYSSSQRLDFTDDAITFARRFAQHAAIGLCHRRQVAQLSDAIDGRTLIGQAQGVLIERFDISADQAFAILRRHSQDRNVKLRVIADELVSNRTLIPPQPHRDVAGD